MKISIIFFKHLIAVISFVILSFFTKGQHVMDTVNTNQVQAIVQRSAFLFNSIYGSSPGYEVPKGSGLNLIFGSFFWFAGTDESLQRRAAINEMFQVFDAQFAGPYSYTNDYLTPKYLEQHKDNMWTFSKSEIQYHIDNFQEEHYTMSPKIKNWPGNGDTTIGMAHQLAPFVDLNNNTIYEPHLGEYPCIKGDQATYMILNDDARPSNYAGEMNMGVELHFMVYQFKGADFIDTTTFVDVTVINRGIHTFNDFTMAYYVDADIGFAFNDYFGTSPENDMIYFYNATNNDPFYGENPPAVGAKLLSHKADYGGYYINSGLTFNMSTIWHFMNGRWPDGTPWYFGGNGYQSSNGATNTPTNFIYPGKPWLNEGWTELNVNGEGTANPIDDDKRGFIVPEKVALAPGEQVTYTYALLTSRKGNHLENVQGIVELAPQAQAFYENEIIGSNCIIEGTGETDDFSIVIDEIDPYLEFEISRLDGQGNMLNLLDLTSESIDEILVNNYAEKPSYQRTKSPISIWITDTLNHATGYFTLHFHSYSQHIDSALWTINRYEYEGGPLIGSVAATQPIGFGEIQEIPEWGISVHIIPYLSPCEVGYWINQCPKRERRPNIVDVSMSFEDKDKPWLTGIKHLPGISPRNWMMSGDEQYDYNLDSYFPSEIKPTCYNSLSGIDALNSYSNLLEGIITSGQLARTNRCGYTPIQLPSFVTFSAYHAIQRNHQPSVYHPSIDIVFTDNKDLWTRCPVIELNNDTLTSLRDSEFGGIPEPGLLRQSKSIDKNGRQAGHPDYNAQEANPNGDQPIGMGWFPGYAIDVESGRRLNMAYGENSMLLTENGGDMQWNPTSNLSNTVGAPLFGGQHAIYVFGGEYHDIPVYDSGNYVFHHLNSRTLAGFQRVYRNLSWVMQPLLEEDFELLSTKTTIKIRIAKEYDTRVITNQNEGRPMFEWNAVPYQSLTKKPDLSFVNLFPNPTDQSISITWEDPDIKKIEIYDSKGSLIHQNTFNEEDFLHVVDVSGFNSGLYIVRLRDKTKRFIISR